MSQADYDYLRMTGELPATSETFISPTYSYSAKYTGVTVKFELNPGTTKQLESIGLRNNASLAKQLYPNMSSANGIKWTEGFAFFKWEGQLNIGLGRGKALEIFNSNIINFIKYKVKENLKNMKLVNKKYLDELLFGRLTNEEFLHLLNIKQDCLEVELYEMLEYSYEKSLSENTETVIYLIYKFNVYSTKFVDILNHLIICDWHELHESIATLLQYLKSPKSINYLYTTINKQYKYLDYDEAYALAVKCIWALGDINTRESRQKLQLLVNSDNEIIRNNAKYQLERKI